MPENKDKHKKEAIYIKAYNKDGIEISHMAPYTLSTLPPLKSMDERYSVDNLPPRKILLRGTLDTKNDSLTIDFSTWKSGAYLLEVENDVQESKKTDDQFVRQIFYLYAESDRKPPVKTRKWFVPLQTVFHEREAAEVLLGTSASNAYVLYEIFDSKTALIKREQVKLSNKIRKFTIPYLPEYGNEVSLYISFVKDNKLVSNNVIIRKKQENKQLTIRTKVFRDKIRPGSEEIWDFTITDDAGKPVKAEIMAVMYDRSLDQLRPHNWRFVPRISTWVRPPFWRNYNIPSSGINFNYPPYFNRDADYLSSYLRLYKPSRFSGSYRTYSTGEEEVYSMDGRVSSNVMYDMADIVEEDDKTVPPKPVVPLRKNFSETAFFYPTILSNGEGEFSLRFTAPEAVTGWRLMMLGHTPDLKAGILTKEVTTSKELTVAPNIPRFFRAGDKAVLKTTINNTSNTSLSGETTLELFDPATEKILHHTTVPFTTGKGENTTAAFNFTVPRDINVIGCRISAATASFSDGKQHLVAVVPDEILLTQAIPLFSDTKGTSVHTLTPSSNQRKDYRLTVEIASNPIWYTVAAIPSVQDPGNSNDILTLSAAFYANAVNNAIIQSNDKVAAALKTWEKKSPTGSNPLAENEELKTILTELTPWAREANPSAPKTATLQAFFNKEELLKRQNAIAEKLEQVQNTDGSWSWFKGFPATIYNLQHAHCRRKGVRGRRRDDHLPHTGDARKRSPVFGQYRPQMVR